MAVNEPAQPAPELPTASAALIFVPGISRSWGEHSLRAVADDLMVALDRQTAGYDFSVSPAEAIKYPRSQSSGQHAALGLSISRSPRVGGGNAEPLIDLYELDYVKRLTSEYEKKALLVRAALVFWTFVMGFLRLGRLLVPGARAKPLSHKIQIVLLLVLQVLYALLLFVLFAEIIALVADALTAAQQLRGGPEPSPVASPSPAPSPGSGSGADAGNDGVFASAWAIAEGVWESIWGRILRIAAAAGVLLWLILPPRQKFKEAIINSATDYLAVDRYLSGGAGAPRLAGEIDGLLEAIRDTAPQYRRMDLCSYSLGSIVAINAMFPFGTTPPAGSAVGNVTTLVTIGCPFDMVRLVRPGYFKGRKWLQPGPGWLNIYTPADILGSNFRDDEDEAPADPAVVERATATESDQSPDFPVPVNVAYHPGGVPPGGFLQGFRVHGSYWDPDGSGENSCFVQVVEKLYAGDPILGNPPAPADGGG